MSLNSNGKQYWRSLDDLADSPKFHEWLHRHGRAILTWGLTAAGVYMIVHGIMVAASG